MGNKTHIAIRDMTELILEDSGNVIFSTLDLDNIIQDALTEVAEYDAQKVKHIIPVTDDSKEIDISGITGLIDVDYIEYLVDQEPVQRRSHSIWGDSLKMDLATAPSASETGTLTGTLTFTTDSTAVTGSGTKFTTELEEGFYIQPGSTWYRIASITDATNLVLTAVAESDDNGADTATKYWFEYAYLFCRKVHTLTTLTDLAGAIDLTAGYDKGATLIHVDELGTGTIPKNTILTIVGVPGSYRVTADAVIGSNEVNITISPTLAGRAPDDAVVNIRSSSLTPELERLLPELAAARAAFNYVGIARTQIKNTITAIDLANTQVDSAVTQCAAIVTGIGDETVSGGTIETAIELANTQMDLGIGDLAVMQTDITDNDSAFDTAITAVNDELDLAKTSLGLIAATVDTVTTGADPEGKRAQEALGRISLAHGYVAEARALQSEKNDYRDLALVEFQSARVSLLEAQAYIALEGAVTRENALSVSAYLQAAGGYMREGTGRLNVSTALNGMQAWARYKLETTLQSLRRLVRPRQKFYGYSRS